MRSAIMKIIAVFFIWLPGILSSQAQPVSKTVIHNREKYFNKIYRLIDENFYYRDRINGRSYFKDFRKKFLEAPGDDKAYAVLKEMMHSLEGKHCGFLTPHQVDSLSNPLKPVFPSGKIIDNNIAMIELPACMVSQDLSISYVDTMQQVISRLDKFHPDGWIIDLRNNNGGSASAMLAALHAFFPNGTILYGSGRDGNTRMAIEDGIYKQYSREKISYSFQSRRKTTLSDPKAPVVVLTSRRTGSAAEMVVIAFRGLPNVMTMGEKTAGVPTGNVSFILSDGALLYITRAIFSDLNGVSYTGPIIPDREIKVDNDAVVYSSATGWIGGKNKNSK
jgi:carboxyl-terminal processing protease